MKVGIYIRTSTTDQNPENQLKDCVSINKWGDYEVFKEQQSAFKDFEQRDVFKKVLSLIKTRQLKHFICWDLDRIYRNRKKLNEFFKLCKVYKCAIHSYRQQWLDQLNDIPEPFNEIMYEMMLQIMGWVAEMESTHKAQRVKAAIRKRSDGAYSYKGNKWGRKQLSSFKKNRIISLREQGKSMRFISKEVGVSLGTVHKLVSKL